MSVRPIASHASRLMLYGGIGAGAAIALPFAADRLTELPTTADGSSPGEIDRYEARRMFSGLDGWPKYVGFAALLPISILYSKARNAPPPAELVSKLDDFGTYMAASMTSPKELEFLKASYGILGGVLIGTMTAPLLLPELPERRTTHEYVDPDVRHELVQQGVDE